MSQVEPVAGGDDPAKGICVDAGAREKQRSDVADVALPIGKRLAAVHQILGRIARERARGDRIIPVPEVVAERGVAAPLGQQHVAKVSSQ